MSISYTDLMNSMQNDGDKRHRLTITPDWMQGRTTYGGLSAAIVHEAVVKSYADLPPLRSAMISFIGPAGGDVEITHQVLREGKSTSFIQADVMGEKGPATRILFVFGASRPSEFQECHLPMPDVPGPDDLGRMLPKGRGPAFTDHFDVRLAKGGAPFSGSADHDHYMWVRHEEAVSGVTALLALADMPPPAIAPKFHEPAPLSSMTWMFNLVMAEPVTTDGWWLLQHRAEVARDGYSTQDMTIWNRAGDLVVTGKQSVAIFA